MIIGVAHIALIVFEYDEAIEFYCDKLGFVVSEDTQLATKRWVRLKSPRDTGS
jgi:catechol 2,3-dioxygenase-like lactoylglutathione lyase family enzyme